MSADREAGLHDLPEHLRLSRIDPWAACGSIRTTAVVRTLSHPRTLMAFLDEVEKIMAKLAQARDADEPTWREEWRVIHLWKDAACGSCWSSCDTEEQARRDAAQAVSEGTWGNVWIEHRRSAATEWERVD